MKRKIKIFFKKVNEVISDIFGNLIGEIILTLILTALGLLLLRLFGLI